MGVTVRTAPGFPGRFSREHNTLTPTRAQAAIAAALLRQLHAVLTTGRAWDPEVAAHGRRGKATLAAA